MEYSDDDIDDVLDGLIKRGLIEEAGIDPESGQQTYRITEKGKQVIPEMYEESISMNNMICFSLWEKDMIKLSFDEEDGLPLVALNKNSFDEEKIKLLPEAEKFVLKQLVLTISDIESFIRDLDDII